jgi:hypothetical protein
MENFMASKGSIPIKYWSGGGGGRPGGDPGAKGGAGGAGAHLLHTRGRGLGRILRQRTLLQGRQAPQRGNTIQLRYSIGYKKRIFLTIYSDEQ